MKPLDITGVPQILVRHTSTYFPKLPRLSFLLSKWDHFISGGLGQERTTKGHGATLPGDGVVLNHMALTQHLPNLVELQAER